jgi:putative membrane protein
MERPESIMPSNSLTEKYVLSEKQAIKLIIIFHAVGLIGFITPILQPIFLKLVPWHLMFMFIIIFLRHRDLSKKFLFYIITIFIIGYAAEWTGVNRHLLFGNYSYGKTLGIKPTGVPLIIGINWFLLTYSAGALMQRIRVNLLVKVILGSAMLVLLDLLIEPVAIRFDYWHWVGSAVPLMNYVCWFAVSCIMLVIFEIFSFKYQNRAAIVLLVVQFVFFLALDLVS